MTAAALLAACSPVYYHGPVSDHFDGRHFFNPDGQSGKGGAYARNKLKYAYLNATRKRTWPASIPVTPSVPPARVEDGAMLATWIGHSTVLVQADGLNMLTDPVWAERASPTQFSGPKRVRQPGVRLADLPRIDLILLSHDHYDHMDMATLKALWRRDHPLIVTGIGNDARLAAEGVRATGADWGTVVPVRPGIAVRVDRVHHWSERALRDRDATLWCGFTVSLPHGDVYFAGDTGPGDMSWVAQGHVARAPRLALIPIGAIRATGQASGNHIDPAQAVTAFEQLGAGAALGIHWGTFELTSEAVDEPPRLLGEALAREHVDPRRFRVLDPGVAWSIPPMQSSAN